MTKGEMRYVLRRRLQESTPNQWSNADLDRLLSLGVQEGEKRIITIQPEAFKREYRADQVVNQEFYEWPVGTWTAMKVALGTATAGYGRLDPLSLTQAEAGEVGYVPWDSKYFMLSPTPTSSVTAGIQVIVIPTLTMYDDAEVCPLPLFAHMAAVLYGEVFALGDVGEVAAGAHAEVDRIFKEMPGFVQIDNGPKYFAPDTGREY